VTNTDIKRGPKKRIVIKSGDVFKIDLGDSTHCYAHICKGRTLTIFYDYNGEEELDLVQISALNILFKTSIYNYVPRTENWIRVGNIASEELDIEPYFYKKDPISGQLYLYHSEFAETNYERKATLAEIEGLERASVWAENHIEDRLRDHYAGRPCKWLN